MPSSHKSVTRSGHSSFFIRHFSFVIRHSFFVFLLACNTFYEFTTIPGPEDLATDVVAGGLATRTSPPPSPTSGPTSTAQPTLTAEFEDLAQFQAAMRPEFTADADQFPNATR